MPPPTHHLTLDELRQADLGRGGANRIAWLHAQALEHLDRLAAALQDALAFGGHAEHCLSEDFARPYFGPVNSTRPCDCWMARATAALEKLNGRTTR